MTITADTPISALMDADKVASLCGQFEARVNSFKETASSTLNSEIKAGLSGENCLVAGEALLEDAGSKAISSVNNVDTGVLSKITSTAKLKRTEELIMLRFMVVLKINSLKSLKANIQNKPDPAPEDAGKIASIQADIDKYTKKLDEVNSALGSI